MARRERTKKELLDAARDLTLDILDKGKELTNTMFAYWGGGGVSGTADPPLELTVVTLANYEDFWLDVTDPIGTVAGSLSAINVEYRPVAGAWLPVKSLARCQSAGNNRHITCVEHGIEGTVLPNTTYEYRLTHAGTELTGTITTRDEPAQFTCATVTSPLSSTAAIKAAINSGNDKEIVIADGSYYFGPSDTLNLTARFLVRIRAQNPGNVTFHGYQETLDSTWTSEGAGVWSNTVSSKANEQYIVYWNDEMLGPANDLASLKTSKAGWSWSGTTTIYVKLTDGSNPNTGTVKISNSKRCMDIVGCSEIDIDGIKFEGFTHRELSGETPRTIYFRGYNADITIQNCTFTKTATIGQFADNTSNLIRFTFQDNLCADRITHMWWNKIKNAGQGSRNYEGLSGFEIRNEESIQQQMVVRRNTVYGGNGLIVGDDPLNSQVTERAEGLIMGFSFYENQFGNKDDQYCLDDSIEIFGNVRGVSFRHNKLYGGGLTFFNLATWNVGPCFITRNTMKYLGWTQPNEGSSLTKYIFKFAPATGSFPNAATLGTTIVAHNTVSMDPPTGQRLPPLVNNISSGSWALYDPKLNINETPLFLHNNIWKFVTDNPGSVFVCLYNEGTYNANNHIIHDGDIFDIIGNGGKFFSNRGGNPTTIAAYNTAAGVNRLTNCLQQSATLDSVYIPTSPVAKISYPGYNELTNRGSDLALDLGT